MGITHVIRGEEWITSTPKHIMLYEAFGWKAPNHLHLPLLRNPDKTKISKRKNPTSILYYKRKGILPDALFNFLALMGYHPPGDQEKVSRDELIKTFDSSRIHLGGPVFDQQKLSWLSGMYLRELETDRYLDALRRGLLSDDHLKNVINLMRERTETLDEFMSKGAFFFTGDLKVPLEDLLPKKGDPHRLADAFSKLLELIDAITEWSAPRIHECLDQLMQTTGLKAKDLLMPIRMSVTGRRDSPPLAESMEVLGKEIVRKRLRDSLEILAESTATGAQA
jgi:glutamyl-tRNA synthetase